MKTLFLPLIFFGFCSSLFSQTTIESFPIAICCNKTTNLIFLYPIKSVDRGSRAVLAQKANGAENILQLKAATEDFPATNLSVITSDGKLFSFLVRYAANPPILTISFATMRNEPDTGVKKWSLPNIQLSVQKINDYILSTDDSLVLSKKHFLHHRTSGYGMQITLHGVYIRDNLLWFTFSAENKSFLDYYGIYLRCFLADTKRVSRTAIQEIELPVLYPASTLIVVPGKKKKQFALAFSPFSFAKNKKMVVAMSEKNGGRPLLLSIGYKPILRARLIR